MAEGELAAVRAQIKTWEREFRSAKGRDPSVQDIKDHPHIGTSPALVVSRRVRTTQSSRSREVQAIQENNQGRRRLFVESPTISAPFEFSILFACSHYSKVSSSDGRRSSTWFQSVLPRQEQESWQAEMPRPLDVVCLSPVQGAVFRQSFCHSIKA